MKASTAGSARPSLSPDSRLSEWRTSRGTRGFVTTEEESAGSVGESSAPRRQDSSQPSPTTQCATSATSAPVDRHRRARACGTADATPSGASRPRPRGRRGRGSRSGRTIARSCTKPERASNSSTSSPPWPSAKPVRDEQRGERQERPPHEPRDEGAHHQQAPEHEQHDLERHRDRVSQRVRRGRV